MIVPILVYITNFIRKKVYKLLQFALWNTLYGTTHLIQVQFDEPKIFYNLTFV
jgi:hypothetical protein